MVTKKTENIISKLRMLEKVQRIQYLNDTLKLCDDILNFNDMNNTETTDKETSSSALIKNSDDKNTEDINIDINDIKKSFPTGIDKWIDGKKQAWNHLDGEVLPTEEKKNGPWSEEEKTIFLKALKDHPPIKGQWSIFSRYIPSRDGNQCSAFYKRLVSSGEIEDIVSTNKKPNTNNTSNGNNNTNSTNNTHDNKTQQNSRKKTVILNTPNSSRLQSIVSFLYLPHKSSAFDKYNISLINRRPPQEKTESNQINFDGSEYAYNNTLAIPTKNEFIINPKNESKSSFHKLLAEDLNDSRSEAKFDRFSYEYFKFD